MAKSITQEESMGCGIACVAFALRKSYKATKKLFDNPQYSQSRGYYCRELVKVLNKNGLNYTSNLNVYQLALQTRDQAISVAQTALSQANASLNLVLASARPEDIASAQAQIQNAYGILISNSFS